jgi:hypothetical protein
MAQFLVGYIESGMNGIGLFMKNNKMPITAHDIGPVTGMVIQFGDYQGQ